MSLFFLHLTRKRVETLSFCISGGIGREKTTPSPKNWVLRRFHKSPLSHNRTGFGNRFCASLPGVFPFVMVSPHQWQRGYHGLGFQGCIGLCLLFAS
jgi:hypothetical protein